MKENVNASKYECTENRNGYRSGHYERKFTTTAGDVKLKAPKLKGIQFETAIIERYKRRECSVEEVLMLVCARLRYVAASDWGTRRYLNMDHLFQMELMNNAETAEASVG